MTADSFPPDESVKTARMRPRNAFVLVVHEAGDRGTGTLVSRVAGEQARRLVFIAPPSDRDIDFFEQTGCHWLATPVKPQELLTLVRAVSSR